MSVPVGTAQINGRGGRPTEDRFVVKELPGGDLIAAVFDGHSGSFTVNFTQRKLPDAIAKVLAEAGEDQEALRAGLRQAFLENDRMIAEQGAIHYKDSGSTGSVCIMTKKHLILASIGDSPMFVFHPDTGAVLHEARPHLPDVPEEKARIERVGGFVSDDVPPRVNGMLMVTRAFGDYELKFEDPKVPEFEKDWFKDFKVTPEPEIHIMERPARGMVAICSDGLVETKDEGGLLTAAQVATKIREELGRHDRDVKRTAQAVVDGHIRDIAGTYNTYKQNEYDDITLVLFDCSTAAAGGGRAAFTRKSKRRRRMRTGKRKLPKRIYI